jgi:hypothetical protein
MVSHTVHHVSDLTSVQKEAQSRHCAAHFTANSAMLVLQRQWLSPSAADSKCASIRLHGQKCQHWPQRRCAQILQIRSSLVYEALVEDN